MGVDIGRSHKSKGKKGLTGFNGTKKHKTKLFYIKTGKKVLVFGLLIVTTDVVSGLTERLSGAGTAGQERCDDAAASGADSPHNSHARGGLSRVQPLHPH